MKNHLIIHVVLALLYVAGGIWGAVEFLLYLFKDDPFNWTPVWIFSFGIIGLFINWLMLFSKNNK